MISSHPPLQHYSNALGHLLCACFCADKDIKRSDISVLKDLLYMLPAWDADEYTRYPLFLEREVGLIELNCLMDELYATTDSAARAKHAIETLTLILPLTDEPMVKKTIEHLEEKLKGLPPCPDKYLLFVPKQNAADPVHLILESNQSTESENSSVQLIRDLVASTRRKHYIDKLCLCGTLMAKIALSDGFLDKKETQWIVSLLNNVWEIDLNIAELITQSALDKFCEEICILRTCRQFYEISTLKERVQLLDALVRIAQADEHIDEEEIYAVEEIAYLLRMKTMHAPEEWGKQEDTWIPL